VNHNGKTPGYANTIGTQWSTDELCAESVSNCDLVCKSKSKQTISIELYIAQLISKVLRYDPCVARDHTVLPATHTRTIPAFTPQPQGITALRPVPTYTAW